MAKQPLKHIVKDKQLQVHLDSMAKNMQETQSKLFRPLAVEYGNMVVRMFMGLGGLFGRKKWAKISPKMYQTRARKDGRGQTLPKLRYGTMGGPTKKRFNASSRPLQASMGFRNSFKKISISSKSLVFGSLLTRGGKWIAKDIQHAGRGGRFVLPVYENKQTQNRIQKVLRSFLDFITRK